MRQIAGFALVFVLVGTGGNLVRGARAPNAFGVINSDRIVIPKFC